MSHLELASGDEANRQAARPAVAVPGPTGRLPDGLGLLLPLGLAVLWELLVGAGLVSGRLLPPPSRIFATLAELSQGGELWRHILATSARVFSGFALGVMAGTMMGALSGYSSLSRRLVDPTLQGLRAVPSIAWVPLFILWFGIFEASKVTLIAVGVFFPVYLGILGAILDIDRKIVEVGRVFRLTPFALVRRILLPAILPAYGLALRGGLGLGWMFVVAAEFMGASEGLGYLLVDGQQLGKPDQIVAAILLFAVLGKITDGLLSAGFKPFLRWQDVFAGGGEMLSLRALRKTYPNGVQAVGGIDLTVQQGEIIALVGGSGCGKSTLLRLISGLDHASEGEVVVDGETIRAPHPLVGIVFQEPRLLPWLSVADNIAFGLDHLGASERKAKVQDTLERVGLAAYGPKWPRELSGGQSQRVALARALVTEPHVLLLDEPFSALDAFTRADLQDHLIGLWERYRPTLVLVTHDIEEALVLASRIVIMQPNPGRIAQSFEVALPRPRERHSEAFDAEKRRILKALNATLAQPGKRPGEDGLIQGAGI